MTPAVPLPLLTGGDVDDLGRLEHLGGELLAQRVLGGVDGPQLHQVLARGHVGLGEVPGVRLGHLLGLDGTETELHGGVAVRLGGADLGDSATDRPGSTFI